MHNTEWELESVLRDRARLEAVVQTLEENLAALHENGHVRDEEVVARMHTRMLALEGACDISAVVCCIVLQCGAVCYSVVQCGAVCCSVVQFVTCMHTRMLALEGACDISAVVCCSVLQCGAVRCSVLYTCILGCWLWKVCRTSEL